jgi:transcriptional regulator with XRE-family HTH domain
MNLGEFVKEEREKRGLTQRELGKLAGFTGSFISRIESGKFKGDSAETLASLAAALRIKPEILYNLLYGNKLKYVALSIPKTPDEIVRELNASLPACIPVYDSPNKKEITTYVYIPKVLIGGGKVQGIVSKSDFEGIIKIGDILLCSHSTKASIGDLVICQENNIEVIKRFSKNTKDNCCVIIQSVRNFRAG